MSEGQSDVTSLLRSNWAPGIPGTDPVGPAGALAAFQLLISEHLASVEGDEKTRQKMQRNVDHQRQTLKLAFGSEAEPRQVVYDWAASAGLDEKVGLLVEVLYLEPFAPNEVDYRKRDRKEALEAADDMFGFEPSLRRIGVVAGEATRAHQKRNWAKVGLIGVGAAVLLAMGGYVAAPFIGVALGGAAGLSGAAAAAHGLALLGGGALAAGGAGVAGGMWMVAGALGAAGAVAGAGGAALYQLGAAAATRELIKLQVTFKLAILEGEADMVKAQRVLSSLHGELDSTQTLLEDARLVNDENARRLKDLEETVTALEQAIGWMEEAKSEVA